MTTPEASIEFRHPVRPVDGLSEIRWADAPQVTPAGISIASPTMVTGATPSATVPPSNPTELVWQDLDGQAPTPARVPEPASFGRLLTEWGPVLLAALAIALFTRLVLVQAYHIPSSSMVPTLERGDRVVVNRLSYQFGEVERGQVVVFSKPVGQPGENDLIKRVIGLPGEEIRFENNEVYAGGFRLLEPYLDQPSSTTPRGGVIPGCAQEVPAGDRCTVPEGYVFVMGDNRQGSSDSRVFGPVPIDSIVGRAFLRVWPLNEIGRL